MSFEKSNIFKKLALAIALSSALVGCSDEDPVNDTAASVVGSKVAIATRAADYSAGRIDLHNVESGALELSYEATGSDIRAAAFGSDIYQIGRYNMDHLTKMTPESTDVTYQYSLNDEDDASANAYQIVFASETKAYVIRYGAAKIWIIDPTATSEAGFKIGEIDISAYDSDSPNANSGVLVGNKLFVLMERLDGYSVTKEGYVAVFDINSDTEIPTNQSSEGLMGIPVGVTNPEGLHLNSVNGLLYLTGRGDIFAADTTNAIDGNRFSGGIVTIDPETYVADLLVDDGTEEDNQGFFKNAVTFDATSAYTLTYTGGWAGTNTLRSFNATTGVFADGAIAGLEAADITTIAAAPNNELWAGVNGDAPIVQRIDAATGEATSSFTTELVPLNFAFVE